ncbi:probable threonine protease PRSS50 [Fukomys damarensis]|uniref:probable threonine protease PRSS50 n=1 Tax=Fukomys damarensis TaxID=885580 RepID=UPI00053F8953|nr:probable threonine protease PRSS50 [Fukomys damarensis]
MAVGAQACALLLLLPVGCLGAGRAPIALSNTASVNPGELCTPGATCVPRATTCALGKPRAVHQAPTSQTPLPTPRPTFMPSCGSSFEPDPTLRDAAAMARRAPWMVSVQANDIHVCAGSLIASCWVLAVAHCVNRQNVNYTVRVGSPWIDQETPSGADIPVLQVIVNPGYRPQCFWSWIGQANNIGLLKLQHKLNYSKYVWPICLPDLYYELEAGCRCTVMGWGLSRADGEWPQFRTIQEKEVTILDNKECDEFYHSFSTISSLVWIITSQMVCATDPSREQFCYEVTGEPLICSSEGTSYLVGLVSWGAGCRMSEAPPIFLRVSPYQPWIWAQLSGQPLGLRTPSQALLLALPLPLSLLVAL